MNISEIRKGKAYTDGKDSVRRVLNIKRVHADSKTPNSEDTVVYEMVSGVPADFEDSVGLSPSGFLKFTMKLGDFAEWAKAPVKVMMTGE